MTTRVTAKRRLRERTTAGGRALTDRWHGAYRSWRFRRSLPGARLLREFERAYPDAFFVQIGSNDGKQHDPLRRAILRRRWRGVMVEPVPYVYARLQRNYGRYADRITLENVAVGDRDGELPFYHLAPVEDYEKEGLPRWYDGIGSFRQEHVLKHVTHIPDVADRLVCTEVPTVTFESLCERSRVDAIDLVQIDAEGYDFEVVKSIDFSRHRPRLLVYEHYHLSPSERANCQVHLEAQGYDTLESGMDTWCLARDDLGHRDRQLVRLWSTLKRERTPGWRGSVRRILEERPRLQRLATAGWRRLKRFVEPRRAEIEYWVDFMIQHLTPIEWKMLTQAYDDTTPLPSGAETELSEKSPRLQELRRAYAASGAPVTVPSVWNDDLLGSQLDLKYFRGESPYVWHYREWPRSMALKYFIYTEYVGRRDDRGLLGKLDEDGAFGCWTFEYPGYPRVSRDLLDSANELLFLNRQLGVLDQPGLRVLDIGAGYGRAAHRMIQAGSDVEDYCCVDAVPESTFICEYYLHYRGCSPPARVVPLHELDRNIEPRHFNLAVNIHSFSECSYDAIGWWMDWLERLRVPDLLIIPNDPDELLAFESDGTRRDFRPLVERAGYELSVCEPVLDEPAVRELLGVEDQFFLFHRAV